MIESSIIKTVWFDLIFGFCLDDKKVEKVNWVWVGMPTRIERLLYLEGN
jgi:hypothetical protein